MKKVLSLLMFFPLVLFSLTIDESIQLALKNNRDLLTTKADADIAFAQYKGIKAQLYPQISVSGGFNFNRTGYADDMLPEDANFLNYLPASSSAADSVLAMSMNEIVNNQIPSDPTEKAQLGVSMKVDQVVYLGGKLTGGIKAAKLYDEMQDYSIELKEQEILYQTKENFYATLLAQKAVKINEESYELATQHLNQVLDMYREGLVSEYDKIRAELEVAKLKPSLIEARKNYELAKHNLGIFLGIDDAEFDLEGNIVPNIDFEIYPNSEDLIYNRYELKSLKKVEEMREIGYKVEKGNFLPNVALSAEFQYANEGDEYSLDMDEYVTIGSIGIGFSMPIFTGGQNYYKIKEAKHELRKAQFTKSDVEEKLKLDIRNAILSFNFAKEKSQEQNVNIKLAEKGLQIAEERYKNQVGIQLEVFDAQLQHKAAKLEKISADYQLLMAQEYYKKAIGMLKEAN